jgi:enoyl-CoA hydratase/carnithine racemase
VVTLNSPETGNQIDSALARAFRKACEVIAGDPGVRAVIVRSKLPDFCVGGCPGKTPAPDFANDRVAGPLGQLAQPVVAALSGAVADQGLELALAADIRIASPDAHFAMRQVVNGAFPFDGGTQRLTRITGPGLATEMLLTGRELNADEAYSRGLISEIAADPHARADQVALDIARHGVLASAYTKKAVLAAADMTFEEGAHLEADLSFLLHGDEEREEGLAAFREGRGPRMPGAPRRPPALGRAMQKSQDGA